MRVKRYIIVLLLLCMVVAVLPTAAAASNDENHIPVTYYISNGVLTVVGTGVMGALPISDGPGDQKIREVVIAEGITEISAHVFSNLPHLCVTPVYLGRSPTAITIQRTFQLLINSS